MSCRKDLASIGKRHGLPVPKEDDEQKVVVQYMELHRICFAHIPNGGKRNKIVAAKLKGQGTKAGVPDLLIFDAPPLYPNSPGAAIEMKRVKGGTVSPEQKEWLGKLQGRGWRVCVAKGADEALEFLKFLGYGRR